MDYSEKWGRDVDEAVRLALEDLQLKEDQVMVTVLEEPTKGFLGLGQKLAKVRVEKINIDEEKEAEEIKRENRRVTRDLRKKKKPGQNGAKGGQQHRNTDRKDKYDHGDRGAGRRNSRPNRSDDFNYDDIPEFDFSDKPSLSERPADLKEVESNDAYEFLKKMIENMKLTVESKVFESDECVFIEVSGEDSKTVIGKRGQTLDSMQYLTNLVANKNREVYRRVIIDVEGYRSRREKTLEKLAAKLAHKALKTGRSVRLEPMNPYERKVIHSTLQKVDGVETRSEGEEPYRRVIIERVK